MRRFLRDVSRSKCQASQGTARRLRLIRLHDRFHGFSRLLVNSAIDWPATLVFFSPVYCALFLHPALDCACHPLLLSDGEGLSTKGMVANVVEDTRLQEFKEYTG